MRLGAVLLAAGASTRLGQPKQLVVHEGETLLRRAARLACEIADPVIVVLPADPSPFFEALVGLRVQPIANPGAAEGVASSLRLGIASLPEVEGVLLLTVDQWALASSHLARLKATFVVDPSRPVAASYGGSMGIPVILPRRQFSEVQALRGDRGAKPLLGEARVVDLPEAAFDLDRPEDLPLRR